MNTKNFASLLLTCLQTTKVENRALLETGIRTDIAGADTLTTRAEPKAGTREKSVGLEVKTKNGPIGHEAKMKNDDADHDLKMTENVAAQRLKMNADAVPSVLKKSLNIALLGVLMSPSLVDYVTKMTAESIGEELHTTIVDTDLTLLILAHLVQARRQ
jgi:hypothetical protein